jgi:hypothetical protein
MKKFFIAALLTVTVATTAFTADDNKISTRIKDNFKTEYAEVDNVTWSVKSDYVKASFEIKGAATSVFYNLEGETIATSKKITLEDLPVHAKRTFAKKYSDYVVKEAIQFDGVDESAYFISAENDKQSVILKVMAGGVSVYKKTLKS